MDLKVVTELFAFYLLTGVFPMKTGFSGHCLGSCRSSIFTPSRKSIHKKNTKTKRPFHRSILRWRQDEMLCEKTRSRAGSTWLPSLPARVHENPGGKHWEEHAANPGWMERPPNIPFFVNFQSECDLGHIGSPALNSTSSQCIQQAEGLYTLCYWQLALRQL